jgi:hypothetical protein
VTGTLDSLQDLAGKLTDPQDRETYAALIAYFRSLPAQDELFHLAQLLGFLSLLGQRLPHAVGEALTEFRAQAKISREYRVALEERLARLPQEIASGVDVDRMTRTMGESFRQQLTAIGLENTVTLLRSSAQSISNLSGEISMASTLLAQEYKAVSATISTELGKLSAASRHLRDYNAKLIVQERWNAWLWQVLLALLLFVAGGFCGAALEKRGVGDAHRVEHSQTTETQAGGSARLKEEAKHLE